MQTHIDKNSLRHYGIKGMEWGKIKKKLERTAEDTKTAVERKIEDTKTKAKRGYEDATSSPSWERDASRTVEDVAKNVKRFAEDRGRDISRGVEDLPDNVESARKAIADKADEVFSGKKKSGGGVLDEAVSEALSENPELAEMIFGLDGDKQDAIWEIISKRISSGESAEQAIETAVTDFFEGKETEITQKEEVQKENVQKEKVQKEKQTPEDVEVEKIISDWRKKNKNASKEEEKTARGFAKAHVEYLKKEKEKEKKNKGKNTHEVINVTTPKIGY